MQHVYLTTAMYHFVSLPHFKTLREPLLKFCVDREIKGTLLLADEGINGTVAGSQKSILELLNYLKTDPIFEGNFKNLGHKESWSDKHPFYRMKVKLKKPVNWFGPYQLAEALCFWAPKTKDKYGFDEKPDWVHNFGNWLAGENHDTWLAKFLTWFDGVRRKFPWNEDKIEIEYFDTWSMDSTLSPIILPMLKQLKATKHGYGLIDDEDVPEELRSTSAPPKENEWDTDDLWFMRWDWILKEMIWAFEQKVDDTSEDQFFDHSQWNGKKPWDSEYTGPGFDKEGYDAWHERKSNGFRLFGKYYESLWT